MSPSPSRSVVLSFLLSGCIGLGCSSNPNGPSAELMTHTLFVAHDDVLTAYDLASGDELPGEVIDVASPVDMQALEGGTVILNLTGRNEVLAVDGRTMLVTARLPSSTNGAVRPVHSLITPLRNGRQYWVTMNDGQSGAAATNSASFFQLPSEETPLTAVGEVALGVGHHKGTFSTRLERAAISNIGDCDKVFGVYDYSNPAQIAEVKTWSAEDLGFDGSSRAKTCDPTYQNGQPPSPHGCATAKVNGKAYCSITASGEIAVIDMDLPAPSLQRIPTAGSGAGYTKTHPAGRYVYSLQEKPREGAGGVTCQVGQLAVVDAQTDALVKELPLLYRGPGCTTAITGTDEETTEPGHLVFTRDAQRLFVGVAGGFGVATARVRQQLVVDVTDPANPVQLASIPTGASSGHHGDALSGDGERFFVVNNADSSITEIDTQTLAVSRTLSVRANPRTIASYGDAEGPSDQVGPKP